MVFNIIFIGENRPKVCSDSKFKILIHGHIRFLFRKISKSSLSTEKFYLTISIYKPKVSMTQKGGDSNWPGLHETVPIERT